MSLSASLIATARPLASQSLTNLGYINPEKLADVAIKVHYKVNEITDKEEEYRLLCIFYRNEYIINYPTL